MCSPLKKGSKSPAREFPKGFHRLGRLLLFAVTLLGPACSPAGAESDAEIYRLARRVAAETQWPPGTRPAVSYLSRDDASELGVSASRPVARLSGGRVLALGRGRISFFDTDWQAARDSWSTCPEATALLPIESLGLLAVVCPRRNQVWLHDLETGGLLQTLTLDGTPGQVAADRSGTRLFVATSKGLSIYVSWQARPERSPWEAVVWQERPAKVWILSPDGGRLSFWDGAAATWTADGNSFWGVGLRATLTSNPMVGGDGTYSADLLTQLLLPVSESQPELEIAKWPLPAAHLPLGQPTQALVLGSGTLACLLAPQTLALFPGERVLLGRPRLLHLPGRPTGLASPLWFQEAPPDAVLVWDQDQEAFSVVPTTPTHPR